MQIESDKDFTQLRKQFGVWRKRFPMFKHDVIQIEHIIERHIQNHSIIMVQHRQTKSRSYLEKAQLEIDAINQVIATVEKMELMAMLSQG
jgi:cystathionine beta-lyase family protein involved in aluminum resistance